MSLRRIEQGGSELGAAAHDEMSTAGRQISGGRGREEPQVPVELRMEQVEESENGQPREPEGRAVVRRGAPPLLPGSYQVLQAFWATLPEEPEPVQAQ